MNKNQLLELLMKHPNCLHGPVLGQTAKVFDELESDGYLVKVRQDLWRLNTENLAVNSRERA